MLQSTDTIRINEKYFTSQEEYVEVLEKLNDVVCVTRVTGEVSL